MDSATVAREQSSLYLLPEQLTPNEANEKARPTETGEERKARVKLMADSIAKNGQEYPVLIVEIAHDGTVTYEYVDGGCRVEAIALLNELTTLAPPRKVWCSLLEPGDDLFRRAVVANLHRTANSVTDMMHIVREARERNGWKGRGTGLKISEYLGILPSRVSEYEKLLHAPESVLERVRTGEIQSLDAALKLLQAPAEERERVVERASEISEEEERAEVESGKKPKPQLTRAKSRPKLKAKHISKAMRETGKQMSRAKSDIIEFITGSTVEPYNEKVQEWSKYFISWIRGKGTDKECAALFDRMVGRKAGSKGRKR